MIEILAETLTWWAWLIGGAMLLTLLCGTLYIAASMVGARKEQQAEEAERERAYNAAQERFERQQERVRARLNSVAGNGHVRETEHGTVRTDLAAFAALLLCMALVVAAIWAASGWGV